MWLETPTNPPPTLQVNSQKMPIYQKKVEEHKENH